MNYAFIASGVVTEIIAAVNGIPLEEQFHPDFLKSLVQCDDSVQQGWLYSDEAFTAPPMPTITSAELEVYAASKRYAIETGGIVVDGVQVMTDRQSQALISGAYNYVQQNPDATVKFKTAAGFVELTATQMTLIANAVGAHVQAAFAAEGTIVAEIAAGSVAAISEIDQRFGSALSS